MTLNTEIYVLDQIDPRSVFDKAAELIGVRPDYRFTDGPHWTTGLNAIAAKPGQGYDAWLILRYRPDGAIATADGNVAALAAHIADSDPDTHRWCDEDEHDVELEHPCWLDLSFDTTYGFRGPNGEDCNDLHASYICKLGAWLDSQGIRWEWENEYTGEIFTGTDGLAKFTHDGDQAQGWFTNDVLPLIGKLGVIQ